MINFSLNLLVCWFFSIEFFSFLNTFFFSVYKMVFVWFLELEFYLSLLTWFLLTLIIFWHLKREFGFPSLYKNSHFTIVFLFSWSKPLHAFSIFIYFSNEILFFKHYFKAFICFFFWLSLEGSIFILWILNF
jgi:hypothetical protein